MQFCKVIVSYKINSKFILYKGRIVKPIYFFKFCDIIKNTLLKSINERGDICAKKRIRKYFNET